MKMGIFFVFSFLILAFVCLVQPNVVGGNPNSVCGGIFEGDAGEVEYHGQNSYVDDASGSSVCVWMIKLLRAGGAGVSLTLKDLDENSVVNFYAEGEPTDPVNTPITMDSSQINSAVELSGKIFIITLKTQLDIDQFENSPTKLVLRWSRLEQLSNINSNTGSKVLPVEFTSTNYFAAGGEKGRYDFQNFYPLQKSVWILDAGVGGSLDSEVRVQLDSSCGSKLDLKNLASEESGIRMSQKALCECSYFGLFEVLPSSGKLRLANEFCGRSGSLNLSKLSTQLVVFVYAGDSNSGSGTEESAEIQWERNNETTIPTTTTTTESTTTPKPPIRASTCPNYTTISPCYCDDDLFTQRFEISCQLGTVTQQSIENSFRELRRVNGIPQDSGFYINQFTLGLTDLTQFDLAPLYGSRLDDLDIGYNGNLIKWVNSGNPQDHGSIHVHSFHLAGGVINGDGFGDTLKYFSNEMTSFYADSLTINNNSDEDEFIPGLSTLTNLNYLKMWDCNISGSLTSSHFKAFPKLRTISLSYNEIDVIGENVFLSHVLDIDLRRNKLNESSFHPNSGIAQNGENGKDLDLSYNQFTTLPSQIFQTFLDAHPQNSLYLENNPLICDERLSWIKSRREEFQSRVDRAICSNDPGHTVFDSNLIP